MTTENPTTKYGSYYGTDDVKVNDVLKIDNILWLATSKGVTKIDQVTRKRVEYTKEQLPDSNVESIAVSKGGIIWIGTYGRGMAVQEDDKWIPIKYLTTDFGDEAVEKDGKILLDGTKDSWLRTNFIHIDSNDTLWVGTSAGVLQLQYKSGEDPVWTGPFNPQDGVLNVLFITDIPRGIEITGNFDRKGYYTEGKSEMKTYRLYNTIPAENGSWRPLIE